MRWASLCAVLSAALLPAANARPLCRPDRGTSSKLAETTATSTAESAYATASVIRSTVTATASATTTDTYSQSTKTESATTSGFATLVSTTATASETLTTAESTTITEGASSTTTTTEAPEPTLINLVQNGDFEDDVNTDWSLRTADIVNDAEKANSPSHYVRLSVEEGMATGGNQVNQTINGLDTSHLFRLSFSSAVFDEPALNIGEAHCDLEGLQQGTVFERWPLDYSSLNEYMSYSAEFKPSDEDITLSFRLRCSTENVVTLAVGIDDVILNDLGVAPVEN